MTIRKLLTSNVGRALLIFPLFLAACLVVVGYIYIYSYLSHETPMTVTEAVQSGFAFIIPFFFILIVVFPSFLFFGCAVMIAVFLKIRKIELHWWELVNLNENERQKVFTTANQRVDRE